MENTIIISDERPCSDKIFTGDNKTVSMKLSPHLATSDIFYNHPDNSLFIFKNTRVKLWFEDNGLIRPIRSNFNISKSLNEDLGVKRNDNGVYIIKYLHFYKSDGGRAEIIKFYRDSLPFFNKEVGEELRRKVLKFLVSKEERGKLKLSIRLIKFIAEQYLVDKSSIKDELSGVTIIRNIDYQNIETNVSDINNLTISLKSNRQDVFYLLIGNEITPINATIGGNDVINGYIKMKGSLSEIQHITHSNMRKFNIFLSKQEAEESKVENRLEYKKMEHEKNKLNLEGVLLDIKRKTAIDSYVLDKLRKEKSFEIEESRLRIEMVKNIKTILEITKPYISKGIDIITSLNKG